MNSLPPFIRRELLADFGGGALELPDSLAESPRDLRNPLCSEYQQNDEEYNNQLKRSWRLKHSVTSEAE